VIADGLMDLKWSWHGLGLAYIELLSLRILKDNGRNSDHVKLLRISCITDLSS